MTVNVGRTVPEEAATNSSNGVTTVAQKLFLLEPQSRSPLPYMPRYHLDVIGRNPTTVFKTAETPPQRIFSSRLETGGRPCLSREWLARPQWLPAMSWLRGILCMPTQTLEFS